MTLLREHVSLVQDEARIGTASDQEPASRRVLKKVRDVCGRKSEELIGFLDAFTGEPAGYECRDCWGPDDAEIPLELEELASLLSETLLCSDSTP
jgi:hypothetical protein